LCLCVPAAAAAREAGRIIVLGAPAVEIVCALGLEERIVGRAAWDLWPPGVRALPQVGGAEAPNLERILALRPDLVVADSNFARLAERLEAYHIPSFTFSAYNAHEIIPAVRLAARALGREARGEELAADLTAMRELVRERLAALPRTEWPAGLALTGGEELYSFSDRSGWTFFSFAGARNICAGLAQPYPVIAREWLRAARADFVLISPYRLDYLEEDREEALASAWAERGRRGSLAGMEAVRGGRLIVLDDLLTFGLRSSLGALYLAKKLHPDLFRDVEPETVHAAFLRKYFHLEAPGRHIYP
jgi:iron complex transport system substrate-binding protein